MDGQECCLLVRLKVQESINDRLSVELIVDARRSLPFHPFSILVSLHDPKVSPFSMEHATSPPSSLGVFLLVEQLSQNLAIASGRLIASFCATSGIMGAHDGNENRPSTVLSWYSTWFFEPWNLARLIGHLFDRREKPWCRKCVHDVYRFTFIPPFSIPLFHRILYVILH